MMDTRYGNLTANEQEKLDAYIVELNKLTHDNEPLGETAEGGLYIVAFKEALIKSRPANE